MNNEPDYFASPAPHYFENPNDPSFITFHYRWKNLPTGIAGEGVIWLRNRLKFLEILNYWNRAENWKYWEL